MCAEMKQNIKQLALQAGFDLVGVAAAEPLADDNRRLSQWLKDGNHGSMHYMQAHEALRHDPKSLWPQARSILMLGLNYRTEQPQTDDSVSGGISCYAWGRDYHKLIVKLSRQLLRSMRDELGLEPQNRICVDSAPLLERAYAARAGLGWIGKNTMLIHPRLGSWFFLSAILWDLELEPDEPMRDHCGTCTACLKGCPTNAFSAPRCLDSRRCIAYQTIEHKGPIPEQLHEGIGTHLFGCDVCQQVCPFNRRAQVSQHPEFNMREELRTMTLEDYAALSEHEFQALFQGSAVRRTGHANFLRNVEVVQSNSNP